jgi:hypothetical protein
MLTMRRREQAPAGALRARTRPLELTSEQAGEDLVLLRREMFADAHVAPGGSV